jgi:hypothetical protein
MTRTGYQAGITLTAAGWGALIIMPFLSPAGEVGGGGAAVALTIVAAGLALVVCGCTTMVLASLHRPGATPTMRDPATWREPAFKDPVPPRTARTASPPAFMLPTESVVARGKLGDREHTLLADGSVILETRLGRRRFASIAEARSFIGA